jgi:hypothetical protein
VIGVSNPQRVHLWVKRLLLDQIHSVPSGGRACWKEAGLYHENLRPPLEPKPHGTS